MITKAKLVEKIDKLDAVCFYGQPVIQKSELMKVINDNIKIGAL